VQMLQCCDGRRTVQWLGSWKLNHIARVVSAAENIHIIFSHADPRLVYVVHKSFATSSDDFISFCMGLVFHFVIQATKHAVIY